MPSERTRYAASMHAAPLGFAGDCCVCVVCSFVVVVVDDGTGTRVGSWRMGPTKTGAAER